MIQIIIEMPTFIHPRVTTKYYINCNTNWLGGGGTLQENISTMTGLQAPLHGELVLERAYTFQYKPAIASWYLLTRY